MMAFRWMNMGDAIEAWSRPERQPCAYMARRRKRRVHRNKQRRLIRWWLKIPSDGGCARWPSSCRVVSIGPDTTVAI